MNKIPTALSALEYIAEFHDKAININNLQYQLYAPKEIDFLTLCRFAKLAGFKAKEIKLYIDKISSRNLPAIALFNGVYIIIDSVTESSVTVYHPEIKKFSRYDKSFFISNCSKNIILITPSIDKIKLIPFGFEWFYPLIKKYHEHLKIIIIISLFIQAIAIATPLLFSNIIDKALIGRNLSTLHVLGFAMLSLAIFDPLLTYIRNRIFSNLSNKLNADVGAKVYKHLTSIGLKYFSNKQTGETTSRLQEMNQIRQFISGSSLTIILDVIFVFIFIFALFFYSKKLTLIVILSLITYFLFWFVIGSKLYHNVKKEYEQSEKSGGLLTELITGIETVKSQSLETNFIQKWQQQLSIELKSGLKAKIISIYAQQGVTLIQKISSAIILWFGVNLVLSEELSVGQLVAFNMLSGQVTQPILRLAQIWQDFQYTLVSIRRVGEIIDQPSELNAREFFSPPSIEGKITFDRVCFQYSNNSPEILKTLTFNIDPQEFVGIVGSSGSGKSTITKLIQRLYLPTSGKILIDGIDLAIIDPITLRHNTGVVLQDNFLFSGSIADNIRQSVLTLTDEDVINTAKLVGAHDFIKKLPDGYNTNVGERGTLLSGGQRQRIALARALITNPRILILDEATSALDYQSEAAFLERLPSITKGRTVISIAHRLNTLDSCDRIINLDK